MKLPTGSHDKVSRGPRNEEGFLQLREAHVQNRGPRAALRAPVGGRVRLGHPAQGLCHLPRLLGGQADEGAHIFLLLLHHGSGELLPHSFT